MSQYFSAVGVINLLAHCISLLAFTLVSVPAWSQDGSTSEQKEWRMAGFSLLYKEQCATCHGEQLQGASQAPPLVGRPLTYGDSLKQIRNSIALGSTERGMPVWSKTMTDEQINNLAIYVSEQRAGLTYLDFNVDKTLLIPEQAIQSEAHSFSLQTIINTLDPLPFSIAPLPDRNILLVEKMRGLSIISPDGKQSPLIQNTPPVYHDTAEPDVGLLYGLGWMLDVAIHPDYKNNGWIYLHYGDRCSNCNTISRKTGQAVSMNTLVRGRIRAGKWVDEQVLWQGDIEFYGLLSDAAAGGRIAFDDSGHVYFTVGLKGNDNHTDVQNLHSPWGKIHRINNDGSMPEDNPFVKTPGAQQSIWSYGHRNPQGLEFDTRSRQMWSTEMGPRGGDEVNLLLAGKNYGWPLFSKGVNYDGTTVRYGDKLGIKFNLEDIEQPIVDLTPSPAISSFVFYEGDGFPKWQGNIIVGSLKAASLYRMVFKDNVLVHSETLIKDLARIRDIELGPDGSIYLLLEHSAGGQIILITPALKN
ncbi:MAG: PQQ-dependent sugar dehydrogenase [Halioglobus sp.]